jgi:hypothetical protein
MFVLDLLMTEPVEYVINAVKMLLDKIDYVKPEIP